MYDGTKRVKNEIHLIGINAKSLANCVEKLKQMSKQKAVTHNSLRIGYLHYIIISVAVLKTIHRQLLLLLFF